MSSNHLMDALDKPRAIYIPPAPSIPKAKPIASVVYGVKTKEREIEVVCASHGNRTITQRQLESIEFPEPKCSKCEEESKHIARLTDEAAEKERKEEVAQRMIEYAIGRAAIPLRFKNKTLESYIPENGRSRELKEICTEYAENFENHFKEGRSIIFCGRAGTGKTHLACAIAKVIIGNGRSAIYTTAGNAFRMIKDTYNTKNTETEVIKKFAQPDFLIVDEIGVQYGSDVEKNILFDIINTRYENMKPTMILSNLNGQELIQYAGERVIDRLKENGGIVRVCDWESNRK